MKCYICDAAITRENYSYEHIIINAAGGRLKSRDLICKQCNSDFGEKIDNILANQLNFFANQLMIKRERGDAQPIVGKKESTNEEIRFLPDGTIIPHRPKYEETAENNHVNISMMVRDNAELKKMAASLARKHPQLKEEDIINAAVHRESYIDGYTTFNLNVGGPEVFRAVCKCAVNYFKYKKGDTKYIKPLISYIKGTEDKDIVWMHYKDNLYDLNDDECFHMLHLRGNPTERVLYCYVDYFNTYKYIILLNDSYDGDEIGSTYCFDVLNSKVIEKEFSADYNRATLLDFFINKDVQPFERVQQCFNHTMAISQRRQRENHIGKIIEEGLNNAWGKSKYPNGTIITKEMVDEAVDEIMKKMEPFILHQLKNKN
ncbi:HNH endonuclease [Alistipes sp.]|uniref:HNH endonuclease n=1 Tax=Alistipes sp. TaxID=1872444 RepID=UPI003AEF2AFB